MSKRGVQERMDEETQSVEDPAKILAAQEAEAEEPALVPVFTIVDIYNTIFTHLLPAFVGDTVNKADKQQYRLKAADIALQLTAWELQKLAKS